MMELTKEELAFLRIFMRDGWFYCEVRNMSYSERKLFQSIQDKVTKELLSCGKK